MRHPRTPLHRRLSDSPIYPILAAILLSAIPCIASAAPRYTITPFTPGRPGFTNLDAINDQGWIIGLIDDDPIIGIYRFLWRDGTFTSIPLPLWAAAPPGLNNAGDIVGNGGDDQGNPQAILWKNGQLSFLPKPFDPAAPVVARAINDRGDVVGASSWFPLPVPNRKSVATYWHNGQPINLADSLYGGSEALDINNAGQIIINSDRGDAYAWENGVLRALPNLRGPTSYVHDINNLGQMVGSASRPGPLPLNSIAVLWEGDSITELPHLPGATDSYASGINDQGQIIGSSGYKAALWEDGQVYNLMDLVLNPEGWTKLDQADAINARGQIIGVGYYNNWLTSFLLTPVPEPGPILSAIILACLASLRRHPRPTPT